VPLFGAENNGDNVRSGSNPASLIGADRGGLS
jgi:hypothetical protein